MGMTQCTSKPWKMMGSHTFNGCGFPLGIPNSNNWSLLQMLEFCIAEGISPSGAVKNGKGKWYLRDRDYAILRHKFNDDMEGCGQRYAKSISHLFKYA